MNRHRYFFALLLVFSGALVLIAALGHQRTMEWKAQALPGHRLVVRSLGLTDLSLWTEARYTRHPSQADFFSAFQDFPASFEHFPAGSLVAPPLVFSPVQGPAR